MRVLMVQRSLAPPGGGNAVATWMVHALSDDHQVDTLTVRPWSAPDTNAFYGTAIPETGRTQHVVGAPWSWLAGLPEERATRLRMASVLAAARRLAARYELLITADNYGAFVRPGIQYLHFPAPLQPVPARFGPLVRTYFAGCDRLMGLPWRQAARNLTLANSAWTANGLERDQGLRARVLYPPVIDPGAGLPWHLRHDTFLCLARFHGSKRIETVMSIVRRLRAHALPAARLLIVGSAVDRDYTARLRRFAARDGDWIQFREDLPRAEVNRLIGECRYGLQAMVDEHFGMATAEMARGGCLVFPHDSGGSPEVVGGERAVLWRTEDDAVARISAVARDVPLRDAVRWRLARHTRRFDSARFVAECRAIVRDWASREAAEPGVLQ